MVARPGARQPGRARRPGVRHQGPDHRPGAPGGHRPRRPAFHSGQAGGHAHHASRRAAHARAHRRRQRAAWRGAGRDATRHHQADHRRHQLEQHRRVCVAGLRDPRCARCLPRRNDRHVSCRAQGGCEDRNVGRQSGGDACRGRGGFGPRRAHHGPDEPAARTRTCDRRHRGAWTGRGRARAQREDVPLPAQHRDGCRLLGVLRNSGDASSVSQFRRRFIGNGRADRLQAARHRQNASSECAL